MATPITPSRFRSTCSIFASSFCQRTFCLAGLAFCPTQRDTNNRTLMTGFIAQDLQKANDCSRPGDTVQLRKTLYASIPNQQNLKDQIRVVSKTRSEWY